MGNRKHGVGYPVRARGITDPYQSWVESLNRDAVRNIIENEPGLNLSEIAQRLPRMREALLAQEVEQESRLPAALKESLPKFKRRLPKPGDARKTARKHAYQMLSMGRVEKIRRGYYRLPPESRVPTKLTQSVNELLTHGTPSDWNFPIARDAAIYRIFVNPPRYHDHFAGLLSSLIPRFTHSIFFLDEILEDAIGSGYMSVGVYDHGKKSINLEQLRKGWNDYFEDTKLIVIAFAIDPPRLLEFVQSPIGRGLTTNMLANSWPSIEKSATKRLMLKARLSKIRQKRNTKEATKAS
jgi:hypothetical protein